MAQPHGTRLDAADLAAAAEWRGLARELDMADIARRTLRAAIKTAFSDDAAADACSNLDEHHFADIRASLPMVAQCQQIDVVFSINGNAEFLFKMLTDFKIVPPDHDGGADDSTIGVIDGGGQADADAQYVTRCLADFSQKRFELLFDPVEKHRRAAQNIEGFRNLYQDAWLQVGDGDTDMLLTDIGGQNHSKVSVEIEGARRASAARKRFLGLTDQSRIDQACEFLVYSRARETGKLGQCTARTGAARTDQRQQRRTCLDRVEVALPFAQG